jgi:hypothetical protein
LPHKKSYRVGERSQLIKRGIVKGGNWLP